MTIDVTLILREISMEFQQDKLNFIPNSFRKDQYNTLEINSYEVLKKIKWVTVTGIFVLN